MKLRVFSVLLALTLLFSLAACAPTPSPAVPDEVNVYTLNGTTGFGMAKLMSDAKNEETMKNYTFTVKADAAEVTAALINGDADIAALPTNAAANIYNKTQGGVTILAINTLGCLYLLTNENETVTSFEDLRGKTVYAPAQNPTFILKHLCEKNGLKVGEDVIIDSSSYAAPAALKDAVAAGIVDIAVLPEPMVTVATTAAKTSGNATITTALDLTAEWNKVEKKDSLVQGCIVVRNEFLEAYPEEVEAFLDKYEASIDYLGTNLKDAADLIVENGIFANANVASKAIPNCNVRFVDGAEMKTAMEIYLSVLYGINPAAIGGKMPADDFYYARAEK